MFEPIAVAALMSLSQPITLVAERGEGQVKLQLVGESATPVKARYELEASSGTGNRSVQRGDVTLRPGQRAVLVTLGLGTAGNGWSATLRVRQASGDYEQSLSGE